MVTIWLTSKEWYVLHVLLDREIKNHPENNIIKNILNELDENKPQIDMGSFDFKTEYECEWIGNNDAPIEDLNFSVAVYNHLKRAGINFKSDIERLSEDEVKKIRNINQARLNEIKEKVKLRKE